MDIAELARLLQAADPAAFLVPPRALRRIIRRDRRPGGMTIQVPHRKSLVIDRNVLLGIAGRDELGISHGAVLPPILFLMARPESSRLAALSREQALVKFWQALFHCRVHLAFAQRFPLTPNPSPPGGEGLGVRGEGSEVEIRRRIHQLGQAEFEEARRVLCQEKYLHPPSSARAVYEEFAALYLELRFFAANLLPHLFPAIADFDRIDALLAKDIDAPALFAQTRLEGAPDPVLISTRDAFQSAREPEEEPGGSAPPCSEAHYQKLLAQAAAARRQGNLVRAALLHKQAEAVRPPGSNGQETPTAAADLENLVQRLKPALDLGPPELDEWRQALPALLDRAARGLWPVEARLLFDLQKVCVDQERGIFAVNGLRWLLSLGQRPIKQPLPNQRETQTLKHLRKAARRAVKARIPDLPRQQLVALLQKAVHRREELLRERLRPVLAEVFERVGLQPRNFPERVALHKLLEELLDRITERGFLNIGDLRDTLSRNNLKLADLSGPGELIQGDPLLQIDRELAAALDGAYRPGEVYMRGLQRFSAVAFGTPAGRFLTRFVALPFGGAFVALKGLEELVHVGHHLFTGEKGPHGFHLATLPSVGLLGTFLLCLLNLPSFRRAVGTGLTWFARGLGLLFVDLPAYLVNRPFLQAILQSGPAAFFTRKLLGPVVFTGLLAPCFPLAGYEPTASLAGCGVILLASILVFNSRLGGILQETCIDWIMHFWHRVHADLIPGLFRLVLAFFKKLLEGIERVLYTVDEWLRFKSGEGRLSLVSKAVLGPLWFGLTYILRIYINLLIEPTFNPIKHFPVVTVSHKIMAPLIPTIFPLLETPLLPLGRWIAAPFAGVTLFFLPGIFGFLVWEFKENWKLYRANRSPTLRPAVLGHHGETMLRLMRPGLHSGTLPRLFARLRRAERRAHRTRHWQTVRHQLEALHHVEESLRHFVERELAYLLRRSKGWGLDLHVGEVALGTNRIRIELAGPLTPNPSPQRGEGGNPPPLSPLGRGVGGEGPNRENLWLAFEEHGGWLTAGVSRSGWLGQLSAQQTQLLANALAGLYKLAGVDLVRDQVGSCFEPLPTTFELKGDALVVWGAGDSEAAVKYPLDGEEVLCPVGNQVPAGFPKLAPAQLLYSRAPLFWKDWVETWELDQDGKAPKLPGLEEIRLLPRGQLVSVSG